MAGLFKRDLKAALAQVRFEGKPPARSEHFYPETRNRRTIRISSHEDAPDSNVIHRDRPLAQALIGATIDEMAEVEVSGKTIRMLVERIYPYVEAAE